MTRTVIIGISVVSGAGNNALFRFFALFFPFASSSF